MASKKEGNIITRGLSRLFGAYDPEDYDRDFEDPAKVKPDKKKDKDKKEACPWGPIVPSGTEIMIEVPRAGQKKPDLYTMYEYRKQLWEESGKQPSVDLNKMIQSRANAGDINIRVYLVNWRGEAIIPVEADWEDAPIDTYNEMYNAELAKLDAEKEAARQRAREAREAQEAQDKPSDDQRKQMINDLVEQAKGLNFNQKKELIEMFANDLLLSAIEKNRIMMAKPDEPKDPPDGDPFAADT